MRALIQRVSSSSVSVGGKTTGEISKGLNVLIGVHKNDTEKEAEYIAGKIMRLRIFTDEERKMNLSLQDIKGELLVVSQFTLYGNCRKGNRPSYTDSADAEKAEKLYKYLVDFLETNYSVKVHTGIFRAHMSVDIQNDGPVTLILDSPVKEEV